MKPVTQSRSGEKDGTCFRACLASIFEVPESKVPDFTDDGFMEQVDAYLADRGLCYRRTPIDGTKPVGYSTIEGISPRGGLHACVAFNGKLVHDPHPQDGTGRGLVEPRYYGVLKPVARARDAAYTVAKANAALKRAGIAERLVHGKGYYYFSDGAAASWYDSSIPVFSIAAWDDAKVLWHHNKLANDPHNF